MPKISSRCIGVLLVVLLLLAGAVLSGYLLHRSLLLADPHGDEISFCSKLTGVDCDPALKSSLATRFVIPLAGWGAVYYVALGSLLTLAMVLRRPFSEAAMFVGLLAAVAAAIVGVLLTIVMLAGASGFCVVCAAIHAINFAVPWLLVWASGRSLQRLARDALAAIGLAPRGDLDRAPGVLVSLLVPLLVGVVTFQWVLLQYERAKHGARGAVDDQAVLAEYLGQRQFDMQIDELTPVRGRRDAPVTIAVFSSFRCDGCRELAILLEELRADYPDDVRVILKHFPLSNKCNPSIQVPVQPGACQAAWAAEAAGRQGKFWEFHDALFQAEQIDRQFLDDLARRLALDLPRFQADLESPAVKHRVSADIQLGKLIAIDGTPTVMLNGRLVVGLSEPVLRLLVEHQRNR